ncbi:hypothetical protein B7494_g3405 [Chlorociboria aeruginascens]|nr:hypothetical protein B7494_g3405 [Chlorociboria aeruginascens]
MGRTKPGAPARKKRPAASQKLIAHAVVAASDVAAIPPYFTPPANGSCPILDRIPDEIKLRIWTLAVIVDEPIEPRQLRARSNKFVWSQAQVARDPYGPVSVGAVEPLAFVQLSKVSKELYNTVAGSHLFYKVNSFKFNDPMATINYLVAITSNRLNAIRSIKVIMQYRTESRLSEMFAAIAACKNLQSLEISRHDYYIFNNVPMSKVKGHKELLLAAQGLAHVKVNFVLDSSHTYWFGDNNDANERRVRAEKDRAALERVLQAEQTTIRGTNFPHEKFIQAQLLAELDIHGDGRLGIDKKPGIVASRTRAQLRNVDKIKADGTVPKRPVEKFDLNGELAWRVYQIHDSRQIDDGENQTVEFLLSCSGVHRSWMTINEREEAVEAMGRSWEDVTVLTGSQPRHMILEFYTGHPKADGKQLVLDAWKFQVAHGEDAESSTMSVRDKRSTEQRLQGIIRQQELADRRESEAAAKASRKAAKAAKVVKNRKNRKAGTSS